MTMTIRVDIAEVKSLTRFWRQYFHETPICAHPDCAGIAMEVDAFFPYLDDHNRCQHHFPTGSEHVQHPRTLCRNDRQHAAAGGKRPSGPTHPHPLAGWHPPR